MNLSKQSFENKQFQKKMLINFFFYLFFITWLRDNQTLLQKNGRKKNLAKTLSGIRLISSGEII